MTSQAVERIPRTGVLGGSGANGLKQEARFEKSVLGMWDCRKLKKTIGIAGLSENVGWDYGIGGRIGTPM